MGLVIQYKIDILVRSLGYRISFNSHLILSFYFYFLMVSILSLYFQKNGHHFIFH